MSYLKNIPRRTELLVIAGILCLAVFGMWLHIQKRGEPEGEIASEGEFSGRRDLSAIPSGTGKGSAGAGFQRLERRGTDGILNRDLLTLISGDEVGWEARLEACHRLPAHLTPRECEELLAFLVAETPGDCNPGQWHALVNDALNKLRHQKTPPKKLTETLIGVASSRAEDPVLRDYALQHLRAWFADTDPVVSGNSITREPAEVQAVEGTPKTEFGSVFRLREAARMHGWTHSNSSWCLWRAG